MNNNMICEKCGSEMIYEKKDCDSTWTCPNCNWGIATSYFSPIYLDTTEYTIIISVIPDPSLEIIHFIAELLNCNFVEAKKTLKIGDIKVTRKAIDVITIEKKLKNIGLLYAINPIFPYNLDGEKNDK